MKKASDNKAPAPFEKPSGIATKNGVEYAKDRNTETDYMYAGTDKDAVYQAAVATRQRDSRSELTTMFDSLASSTRSTNNSNNNSNSATTQNRNSNSRRTTTNRNARR